MIIYVVYVNADMTEGRGPMVVDSIWLNKSKAEKYIDSKEGVMGRKNTWSNVAYGDWMIKSMETEDK